MTRDEIIRMAQEIWGKSEWNDAQAERLERFAALVAAKEREACAKACEHLANAVGNENYIAIEQRQFCAKAIRARGLK